MSEKPSAPEGNRDSGAPINSGLTGEGGGADVQRQSNRACPDGVPQAGAASLDTSSLATPVEQNCPADITKANRPDFVTEKQDKSSSMASVTDPAEISKDKDAVQSGTMQCSPADLPDELTAPGSSLEEKFLDAFALVSHDEFLAMGDYANCWEPDRELYEPHESFDLVKQGNNIRISFVEWKGHRPRFSSYNSGATYKGKAYSVPQLPTSIYDAIYLPTNVTTDFSAHQVFEGICHVLRGCPALSDQQCELLSFWCMATWFADQMDFTPRMTITGPRYAADLLFALLSRVCRRAILLAGIKPATLQHIPMKELTPTLLIRQIKPGKSASELLDASDRRRYFVACGKELLDFYCSKCVYVGEQYDAKHADSGLYIHLWRNATSPNVAFPSENATQHLQNCLFTYRSFYLNRMFVRDRAQATGELLLQLDMIAYRLQAVIFEDCELQDRLVELLKAENEQIRADGATSIEATVLKSVLSHCHENESQVYVRNIAVTANRIWLEQGETSKLTNEKVGRILKKLGLYSRRLSSEGRGLALDKAQQHRVHQLASDYDALPAAPECGYCHQVQSQEPEELM